MLVQECRDCGEKFFVETEAELAYKARCVDCWREPARIVPPPPQALTKRLHNALSSRVLLTAAIGQERTLTDFDNA
jgi:hypothetical protein